MILPMAVDLFLLAIIGALCFILFKSINKNAEIYDLLEDQKEQFEAAMKWIEEFHSNLSEYGDYIEWMTKQGVAYSDPVIEELMKRTKKMNDDIDQQLKSFVEIERIESKEEE